MLQRARVDYAGSAALVDYPVVVTVNTAAWVAAGELAPDCHDLAVVDEATGFQRAHYLEPRECNTAATRLWVSLPSIAPASSQTLSVGACGDAIAGAPADVFELFDDFDSPRDWSANPATWIRHGQAVPEQLGDGVLRLLAGVTPHDLAIESVLAPVRAGASVLSVRFRIEANTADDFEIGVGRLTSGTWHETRQGSWATILHYSVRGETYGNGAKCFSTTSPSFLMTNEWYELDFSYQVDTEIHLSADVRGPNGAPISGSSTGCGPLLGPMPVLIVLDDGTDANNPRRELDRMWVRKQAAVEPVVTLL